MHTKIGGAIDHRLNTECTTLLEVLLDTRVFVERADSDVGTPGYDPGCKLTAGVLTDLASKDELDLIWAADIDVIGNG